jgi:hypothetical protein
MTPFFICEFEYIDNAFFSPIYDGLIKLSRENIVKLIIKRCTKKPDYNKPILEMKVNQKNLVYDLLDGFNWIDGTIDENLEYFKNSFKVDYYFKRSYDKQLNNYVPESCKVFPLGMTYPLTTEENLGFNILKNKMKGYIRNNKYFGRLLNLRGDIFTTDFEFYPIPEENAKILFVTRLWDPDKVESLKEKEERKIVNESRIVCIETCKRQFGDLFTGGIYTYDGFPKHIDPAVIVPDPLKDRRIYLKAVKNHSICIATQGLHRTHGCKIGEYIAASRAVISEPLHYELPGSFDIGKNYLEFESTQGLIEKIEYFYSNRDVLHQMMLNNFHYYNNYVRPDSMVLNTLLKVL